MICILVTMPRFVLSIRDRWNDLYNSRASVSKIFGKPKKAVNEDRMFPGIYSQSGKPRS